MSSLHILKDPENGARQGGFFVFPDIGVRAEGRYRLKCTLYEIVEYVDGRYFDVGIGLTSLQVAYDL